jgi:hypothetical protein
MWRMGRGDVMGGFYTIDRHLEGFVGCIGKWLVGVVFGLCVLGLFLPFSSMRQGSDRVLLKRVRRLTTLFVKDWG